jgi:hypothetical protein
VQPCDEDEDEDDILSLILLPCVPTARFTTGPYLTSQRQIRNYADEGNVAIPRIATTNMKNGRVKTGPEPSRAD